jgi:hypothetical protein
MFELDHLLVFLLTKVVTVEAFTDFDLRGSFLSSSIFRPLEQLSKNLPK